MIPRIALSFFILLLAACAGTPDKNVSETAAQGAAGPETAFDEVKGKTWILAELRTPEGVNKLDREALEADNTGDFFTLSFEADRLNGKGAPNRYNGPYTVGEDSTLSIGNVASTMMAALKELDFLKEREYFTLLARVSRWSLDAGNFLLYSQNETGGEVILVFR
jgi:heat shock protein HslJ